MLLVVTLPSSGGHVHESEQLVLNIMLCLMLRTLTCLTLSLPALQHLQDRFGIAYLEKARIGQVWQPWYADLLKQGGLTGAPSLDDLLGKTFTDQFKRS